MKEKKLTKFDALRILGNAYWYVHDMCTATADTKDILHDKFGYVRRSLSISDMAPQISVSVKIEGWNGKGPTHF
jgi:hypothetical protein